MSRPARICTISMNSIVHGGRSSKEDRFREAEGKMQQGSPDKPDLFLLPEIFLVNDVPDAWSDPANMEEEGNATYERLGALARSYSQRGLARHPHPGLLRRRLWPDRDRDLL